MLEQETHEVTQILNDRRVGDKAAAERLFPLVYDELKKQARRYLSAERVEHTLQPTALLHEAYLKMVDRTVLSAEKRGGAAQRFSAEDIDALPAQSAADLLELDEALQKLESLDERKSRVVDMRFFGGLKESEIAEVLGVTEKTVRRDWQFAKLWLLRELSQTI